MHHQVIIAAFVVKLQELWAVSILPPCIGFVFKNKKQYKIINRELQLTLFYTSILVNFFNFNVKYISKSTAFFVFYDLLRNTK